MTRESIDTWLERIILVLVFGAVGFAVMAFGAVRPSDYVIVTWLVLAAAALWIARIWIAPKFRFLLPPLCWAVLPFVAYAIWRWRTADVEFLARVEVMQVVIAALLLLVVVNNLYSQESLRVLSLALLFLGMFAAMYGVYQWLRGSDLVWGLGRPLNYHGRASGPYICPNHLGGLLEMTLPLGLALLVGGRMSALLRIFVAYACFVSMAGIAGTQSRAAWISTFAGVLVLAMFLLRTRRQVWSAIAIVVVVVGAGYWFYNHTIAPRVQQTFLTGNERDVRLRLWTSAWELSKTNLWTGVGPAHFDYRFGAVREAIDKTQARPDRVHNDYLNTLIDYGAVGLALALVPLGVAAWNVSRAWPHLHRGGSDLSSQKKSNRAALVLGATAGIAAMLVHSLFDFNMHIPANGIVLVTLLAIVAIHMRFATERYWFTARLPLALGATVLLAAILTALIPSTITRTRETVLLRRAEGLADGSAEKIALLKSAAEVQPNNFETAYAIGEQLRALAFMGGANYRAQTEEAIPWFQRASALNKWDMNSPIRLGMCLDWIGRHDEAEPHFRRALELEPNYWYSRAMMGWHFFQIEDYQQSLDWMQKSIGVNWNYNPVAVPYRELCVKLLAEEKAKKKP